MTLEISSHSAFSDIGSDAAVERVVKADTGKAADIVTRLSILRNQLGCRSFAVYGSPAAGGMHVASFSPVLEGAGAEAGSPLARLMGGQHGAAFMEHLDQSARPLVWDDGAAHKVDCEPGCKRLVIRKSFTGARCSGIALPVRLGSLGNGYVLFEGDKISLSAERVFSMHRAAYPIMAELLRMDLMQVSPRQSLNDRELACLRWAGDGLKSETIAEKLGLSVHTVNSYLCSATAKLDSVNRIQAIAKAIRLGCIP